jgi:tRNA (guanosine-2'-O-)-methyltransferase
MKKTKETREEKIERVIDNRQEGIIVLEDVHDPHNIGAVCRSAEGLGFQKVWLIFEQEKVFNPKRVGKESSSSANKWLDFEVFKSTEEAINKLKAEGYEIWATTIGLSAKNLWKTKIRSKKIALIFGNEHRGLSKTAQSLADHQLTIPMKGMVQSFNISVTAGLVLGEVSRQRQNDSKTDWKVGTEEREDLKKRWR